MDHGALLVDAIHKEHAHFQNDEAHDGVPQHHFGIAKTGVAGGGHDRRDHGGQGGGEGTPAPAGLPGQQSAGRDVKRQKHQMGGGVKLDGTEQQARGQQDKPVRLKFFAPGRRHP